MHLLNSVLVLGAVTLTAAQNFPIRVNSTTTARVVTPPVTRIIPPFFTTNPLKPGAQPGKPGFINNGTVVVVNSYVTYCPSATVFTVNNKPYTAKGPTTITITNCPCTITKVRTPLLSTFQMMLN